MCPTTSFCRLCLCSSTEYKELINENGQYNDIHEIAAKYFDPMLLTTVLCANCWQHIYEFYEFQQTVLKAQNDLKNVGNNEPLVKLEMMLIDKEEDNEDDIMNNDDNKDGIKEDISISLSNSIALKDYNPFYSEDEISLTEYSTKKIREFEKLRFRENKEYIKKVNNSTSVGNLKEEKGIGEEFTCACIFCDKNFKNAKELRKHTIIHTGEDTYQCPYCVTKFKGNKNISRHVRCLHPNKFAGLNVRKLKSLQEQFNLNSNILKKGIFSTEDVKCHYNAKEKSVKAKDNQLYATSDEEHSVEQDTQNQRKFICTLCDRKYKHAYALRNHIKFTHNREANSSQCPHCPTTISEPRNLRRHIKSMHPDKYIEPEKKDMPKVDLNLIGRDINSTEEHTPNYDDYDAFIAKWKPELECPLCKSAFADFDLLREHFRRKHPNKECYVRCCEYNLKNRVRLVEHLRYHLDPNSFKCEICGRCSNDSISLKLHMRIHNEEKPFQCQVCERRFRQQHKLFLHSGTHSTEKSEFCKICNKGFGNKYLLRKHVYNVHESKTRHLCEQCGIPCCNENALKEHLLEHAVVEKPKWPCDHCGFQFKSSSRLQSHITTCFKAIYVCSECGQNFSNKDSFNLHKRTVHGGECKPKFKCMVCDKELATAVSLQGHIDTHTGENHYQCPHCPLILKQKKNIGRHMKLLHPGEFVRMNQPKLSKVDLSLVEQSIV